jgi:hypothetical protein
MNRGDAKRQRSPLNVGEAGGAEAGRKIFLDRKVGD